MRRSRWLIATLFTSGQASAPAGCGSVPADVTSARSHAVHGVTLDQARALRGVLAAYLQGTKPLAVSDDSAQLLRETLIGEPLQLDDGLAIPPWQLAAATDGGVVLTWTIDPGHESGTRSWFVVGADRVGDGWKVRELGLAHAHRLMNR